ncbi:MAG TPA: fumarylacetoacetate hydrolase family protein [Nitrososphaerales archaeon]|nr:fumarylacetoacetate hydrolase family protein [Nitrososphaerales archaeon]
MKLVTFDEPYYRRERLGIWFPEQDVVVDANLAYARMLKDQGEDYPQRYADAVVPPNLLYVLQGGKRSMNATRESAKFAEEYGITKVRGPVGEEAVFNYSKLKIRAPILHPGKIIHTAGNFREHAKEGSDSGWEFPMPHWISFLKSPTAIVGHEDQVIHPKYTKMLDHEIELAIVIGKKSKHLTKETAWDAIGGFTIFNDITARDIQKEEMKSGLLNFGKNMDTFALFGPCFVPKEDIGDVHKLKIECRVNGDPRQVSNTDHLSVTVPEIVEHYSWVTLEPGDIITTGTVSGVAAFRKEPEKYFLKPGDVLESEIENIGTLRNYIVEEKL